MSLFSDFIEKKQQIKSSRSIRKLLKQKWLIVILTLMLTGLGAALTGVLLKSGVHALNHWKLNLLKEIPSWIVLPSLGGIGGLLSGLLISRVAPSASGSGVSQIMGFLRHRYIPMGLKVGLVKLIAGIIAPNIFPRCGVPVLCMPVNILFT